MRLIETKFTIVRQNLFVRQNLLTAALSALAVMAGFVTANAQSPAAGFHVTICHRTGSASNPYIIISPDAEGVINGHLDHEQTGNGLGGDIVPEFIFNGVRYSKNLNTNFGNGVTGAKILAAGCTAPRRTTPTPTPTPPTGSPTPTPPPPPGTPPPPVPVPEPITLVLFGTGLASIGAAARRKLFPKKK